MALNCNPANNSNLLDQQQKCIKHQEGSYLVVDHGEQIVFNMEESRLELQKQIVSLLEKVCLLWDIVRKSLIFILPVLAGVIVCLITSQCLPKKLAPWVSFIIFSVTIGLIFINLQPLNDAITNFLDHQMYVPSFKSNNSQRNDHVEITEADIAHDMREILLSSELASQETEDLELD